MIDTEIYPILKSLCRDDFSVIRQKAAASLGRVTLFMIKQKNGDEYIKYLHELAKDQSCHIRVGFIYAARIFEENCEILIEHFKEDLETLSSDSVHTIRLKLAGMIRILSKNAELFEDIKSKLQDDKDEDVKYQIIGAYQVQRGVEYLSPGCGGLGIVNPPIFRSTNQCEKTEKIEILSISEAKIASISNYLELDYHMPKDQPPSIEIIR